MQLPVMPPVSPDAGQAGERHSARPALRTQVGRLPVDHLPGRRRGGDRQPEREADDPVFSRSGRGGPGELPEPGGDRRGDHRGATSTATRWISRRCSSGSIPAASRVKLLAGATPASFVAFDLLALGDEDLMGAPLMRAAGGFGAGSGGRGSRRSTSPRRPRISRKRSAGSPSSRVPGSTASSRRSRTCCTSRTSG